ncbi:MAG: DUF427 domain-containing protein [Myxococcales bacterium]|nr:DUF427 domain-containing protein [Myxococcales bacterium]
MRASSKSGHVRREPVGPGQESVWDYPRPPRIEPVAKRVQVVFDGVVLADTQSAYRVLETSHPPVYYLPEGDIRMDLLTRTSRSSFCEWKGVAHYYDVSHGERRAAGAAWAYGAPSALALALAKHVAFYAAMMDACFVDGERVTPQPGGFYGGWITRDVVGPFKGEPGSFGW